MSATTPSQLVDALKWRYATKQFDPQRKIDADTWTALEDALLLSPSSFGIQPWKFLVITDQALRDSLVPASWGQEQVAQASHLVVFALQDPITPEHVSEFMDHTAHIRGVPRESLAGFERVVSGFLEAPPYPLDLRAWAARQVYIALGNFMTSAALIGIDTCPMEGIDPSAYDRILGLEGSGFYTVAACPAGYRAANDKYASLPKVRFPKQRIIQYIP